MAGWKSVGLALSGLVFAFSAWGQSSTDQNPAPDQAQEHKQEPGAAREIGAGAATAGTGAAKGAGDVAKGTAKGVGDAVTLHPIDAAGAVGKGAVTGGKDVTVGAAKGTGKVVRGVGRVFKKLF
jgi:hypothetical protein